MKGLEIGLFPTGADTWYCNFCAAVQSATASSRNSRGLLQAGQNRLLEAFFSWRDSKFDKGRLRHGGVFQNAERRQLGSQSRPFLLDSPAATLSSQNGPADELQTPIEMSRVLEILLQMDRQGTVPSATMYRSLLKACARRKALHLAKRVYAHLAKHGLESNKSVGEYLVSMLVKCGGLDDALQVFYRLPFRTVFSWTAVISGYVSAGRSQEALAMYHSMREQRIGPDQYTFVSLLKACGNLLDLEEGKRIHSDVLKCRCEPDCFVGTALVEMYGKCGSILDAQIIFDSLVQRDVVVWTVLIAAYAQQGQAGKALLLYEQMCKEGVTPDERTLVSAIQACGMLAEKEEDAVVDGRLTKPRSLKRGKAVHADAQRKGYDSDLFVGTTLVSMYGKCGSIVDAHDVFKKLPKRNVVSWNALLGAYAQQGQAHGALRLYDQMLVEGVSPNDRTFVSALQACAMLGEQGRDAVGGQSIQAMALAMGRAIHADVRKKGYGSDVFVCNTLISMYGKCGSITNAKDVFDGLTLVDVVTWNAMLMAYVQQGEGDMALLLYRQIQEKGGSPDDRTFVSVLQACGMLAEKETHVVDQQLIGVMSLEAGKEMHADIWKRGYHSDSFIGNTLVSMYGKCGSIVDAQNVFVGLSQQDVISWNAMLAVYVHQGQGEQAFQLYEQMQEGGVSPDHRSCVSMLQACSLLGEADQEVLVDGQGTKVKYLEKGKVLHAEAWRKGYDVNSFVESTLVTMYGKCGSIVNAQYVFDASSQHDVASWNAMLAAFVQVGESKKALELYAQLQVEGMSPDVRTLVSSLQACTTHAEREDIVVDGGCLKVKSLEIGKAIHADAHVMGYDSDLFVGSTLITMYGKCGVMVDAQNVFDHMPHHSVVAWTSIISVYVEQGTGEKALQLYRQMQAEGVSPDEVTVRSSLQACGSTGRLDVCRQIHEHIMSSGMDLSLLLSTNLLHAYARCASMVEAQDLFDGLSQRDVVSWNALIAGYARQGNYATSLLYYEQMHLDGIRPDGITFLSIISACSHGGLVDKGIEYFESMSRDYGVEPTIEHYVSMVDLLGRAGLFARVKNLLYTMPVQPDLAMWLCVLGACRKHRKVALAREAFDRAVSLQPKHAAAYLMMSNIYADAGMSECAKEVNALEQSALTWKKAPGQTWIEHEDDVNTFEAGGKQAQQEQVEILLRQLASADMTAQCKGDETTRVLIHG